MAVPKYDHVVVVVEENHSENQIVGSGAAPFINNTLIKDGALMTNYSAITHPSEPNYFALYGGSTFGVTDDGTYSEPDPSLATALNAAGKSFAGYIESGSPQKHNPWESFPEGTTVEKDFGSSFPSSNFASLPSVSFVVPNLNDDMHDGTIQQGDTWLQNNLASYETWAKANNSLLITTWDENDGSGGNQVATILDGAGVTPGTYSDPENHYNLLNTIAAAEGATAPRNGGTATPITSPFAAAPPPPPPPPTGFHVANGQIVDPNGNTFVAKGINFPDATNPPSWITNLFPGINFVRLAVSNYTSASAMQNLVTTLTGQHIVVEIEDHQISAPLTGTALTNEQNWYSSLATTFKSNPYVWFGSMNEPQGSPTSQEVATYNTIRGTGNTNPIMIEDGEFGSSPGFAGPATLTPSAYANMTNIIWDAHFYGDSSNYSTDQTTVDNALLGNTTDTGVRAAQTITSADGKVPVIEGEFGPSANAQSTDPNATQTYNAVTQWAIQNGYTSGYVGWYFGTDPNDPNTMTTDTTTLTPWGKQMAAAIAGSSPPPPPPPPPPPGNPTPVVTGTGSDSLVLQISEDAYQGDAQFTVSIDGKQQGGTFTTTAIATSGQKQSFTFNGDWAKGSHSVTVNFLNDAYGGTPTTDRNLYLNSATYDGVNTGQSETFLSAGAQSFAITDTTDIPGGPPPPPPPPGQSPDGTQITKASDAPIIDKSGNSWSLVQSASNGLQIAVNGVVDAPTGNVVLLETLNNWLVQKNAAGDHYAENQPNDSWQWIPSPDSNPAVSGGVMTLTSSNTENSIFLNNTTIKATSGDHLTFIGGSGDTINMTGGTESITDANGNNTIVLPAQNKGKDDLWGGVFTDGDKLDLRPALAATKWNGSSSTIGNFVHVSMSGSDALVKISANSGGAGSLVADLHGVGTTNLQTLLAHSITS